MAERVKGRVVVLAVTAPVTRRDVDVVISGNTEVELANDVVEAELIVKKPARP